MNLTVTLNFIKSENNWVINGNETSGEVLKQAEFKLPKGLIIQMHGYSEMRVDLVDTQNVRYAHVCTDKKGNPFVWIDRKRVYLEEVKG